MNISNETFKEAKLLAKVWQKQIQISRDSKEEEFHELMLKMFKNPRNKAFLIELLDQSLRSKDNDRVAKQIEYIFSLYEDVDFLSDFEKVLVWLLRDVGIYLSSVSIPMFMSYLRNDVSSVIIDGQESVLNKHIQKRRDEGTRVNINIIGEIVLSEKEADSRMNKYILALENPNIDYLSIKISNLFSQIIPHAYKHNMQNISKRLEKIFDSAMSNTYEDKDLQQHYKFVNLDMEEYKDLELTMDVFKQTLSMEKYKALSAGIVIQAYLPDALECAKDLAEWAKKRVENGGSSVKVRLVKGANQEMELAESSLRDWENPTYSTKVETDANYKLLMDFLISKDVSPYVNVGIASHNIFEHALAMLLAKQRGVEEFCSFEMLEGMSEAAYHTLKNYGLNVILYAPTATKDTFANAIAYLVRRFDENTAEENFLRHSFGLNIDTPAWEKLLDSYDKAVNTLDSLKTKPYRQQDRTKKEFIKERDLGNYVFENCSDTDFCLKQNRKWAEDIRDKWQNISKYGGFDAHVVVGGKTVLCKDSVEVIDKSQTATKPVVGSYAKASKKDLQDAIGVAKRDPDGWRDLEYGQRQNILMDVALKFEQNRAELIGVAAAELSKVFTETDTEISEAIDFLNFYPYSVREIQKLEGVSIKPKGIGLVISPWNFPIAIPAGGIAATLAAGNTVILKPSSNSVLSAYMLCQCFWDAGVSKNTLQFVPCDSSLASEVLIPSKDIDFTIFTGSEKTAYSMIKTRPDIRLSAETGGKDATIVTALSDREQAIKNVLVSAFHNSGQKCSATSLLVLEKELYEDEDFKNTLLDATLSLEVGSVWDFKNRVSALVDLPNENLKKAIEYLDKGEEWIIEPSYAENNPYMLKPSIRWGTKEGDFCHKNELFGPVLSVMCANDIEDAVGIVNSTGYGLTSGIESLDKREQEYFKQNLKAGNLYVNRSTTGAIVMRQPFGGMNKSAIGSGKKAGGFNYVSQFMDIESSSIQTYENVENVYMDKLKNLLSNKDGKTQEIYKALKCVNNFSYWLDKEFLQEHDYVNIRGQRNIFRYLSVDSVLLRVENGVKFSEILSSIIAIKMIGAKLHLSLRNGMEFIAKSLLDVDDILSNDSEDEFISMIKQYDRVRYLSNEQVSKNIYESISKDALYIASDRFVAHGRVELMHYFVEQSISDTYHRYGNLGLQHK